MARAGGPMDAVHWCSCGPWNGRKTREPSGPERRRGEQGIAFGCRRIGCLIRPATGSVDSSASPNLPNFSHNEKNATRTARDAGLDAVLHAERFCVRVSAEPPCPLLLRSRQAQVTLGAEDVAVEA